MKKILWLFIIVTICDAGLHGSEQGRNSFLRSAFDRRTSAHGVGVTGYKISPDRKFYFQGKNRYEQEKRRVKRILTEQEARVDKLVENFLSHYSDSYYKLNEFLLSIQQISSKAQRLLDNINQQEEPNEQCVRDLNTMLRNNGRFEGEIQNKIDLINSNWDYFFQAINSKLDHIENSPVEMYIDDNNSASAMSSRVDLMGSGGLESVEALESSRSRAKNTLSLEDPLSEITSFFLPRIKNYYEKCSNAYEVIVQRCPRSSGRKVAPKELNSTAVFQEVILDPSELGPNDI